MCAVDSNADVDVDADADADELILMIFWCSMTIDK